MTRVFPMVVMTIIITTPAIVMANSAGGKAGFSTQRGEELWNRKFTVSAQPRSCATCHTSDPRLAGKHLRTSKLIKPMAPSVNPDRFTDQRKSEKWFKRNCKWTLGRVCTEQEKGDLLEYLKTQ
jgi:hypothetical protein